MRRSLQASVTVLGTAMLLLVAGPVAAQMFPTKPVTLVIPVGAGGSHDLTARALTAVIPQHLGQPMLVELRPGGGGAIGSTQVANTKPDGYTLLFGGPGWTSALPAIEGRSVGVDRLDPVARVNYSPMIMLARPEAPFGTLKEMVDWAKSHTGQLVHGHTGPWGAADLPMKQLMHKHGFTAKIVPHDGGGPAMLAILGGHIQTTFSLTAQSLPHVRAGKLKVLAVMDTKRHRDLPDVPTSVEQGFDVTYTIWRGVLAPKGTPRPVIEKLADAIKKTSADKSFVALVRQLGDDPGYLGPDEWRKELQREYEIHQEIGRIFKK